MTIDSDRTARRSTPHIRTCPTPDLSGERKSCSAVPQRLVAIAYTVKFTSKRERGEDFVVGPLEGLWWADDMDDFLARRKDNWRWRLLINVPDRITDRMIEDARQTALAKKSNPALRDVRPETLREGTSAQVLHIGPYDDETPILTRLHHYYLPANDLREAGLHHEIYLSDPRRTDPAKLRTVLRQPVETKKTSESPDGRPGCAETPPSGDG